ncbi:MAG: hypothetical protein IT293_05465 [Deltaproteobacteria bacterium]|nr:hypothetical protein [Deltaproteobacteria bacterium]
MFHLTKPHERALFLVFSELARQASETPVVLLGTPGTIAERTNAEGTRFWVRRYSDASGARREQYVGKTDDSESAAGVQNLRLQIASANAAIASVRLLARSGYATVDKKAFFTLASLHNRGVFRAGGFLIGTHAYGALLNALGVRAVAYATEDVDIARGERLALPEVPSFLGMLRESGVEFVEVPQLDRRAPAVSFKERGVSRFRVDLLVPSKNEKYPVIPVPELQAHATGLPYLAYLLGPSQMVPILSAHGVAEVRIPAAERYATHKILVSQLRGSAGAKTGKDLQQAAVLVDALTEQFPGALGEAVDALPKSARRLFGRGLKALRAHLPRTAETAWESLEAGQS